MVTTGQLEAMRQVASGKYDPRALGARCGECMLAKMRVGGPVPPEFHDGATIAVVAEAPGEKEVEGGRPLIGPSGLELGASMTAVGVKRTAVHLLNALACRPPENELGRVRLKLEKENRKRKAAGDPPLPTPIDCCRPRLMVELGGVGDIVTLGRTSYEAVTRAPKSILEIRGGTVEGWLDEAGSFGLGDPGDDAHRVRVRMLPTVHPAFVLRFRRWTRAFRGDLGRAFRWFSTGRLGWVEPQTTLNPSPDQLARFIERTDIDWCYDVETTVDDPLVADLWCVGVGHAHAGMVPFLKSQETGRCPYNSRDETRIRDVLTSFFTDPQRLKIGWNHGYFDRMVVQRHFGVIPVPIIDGILLHRLVEGELPHSLAYAGSVYTDVPSWKSEHIRDRVTTDAEKGTYCIRDVAVTAQTLTKLVDAVMVRHQDHLVAKDHAVQEMCVGLHENGLFVDMEVRNEIAHDLVSKIADLRAQVQKAGGRPDLNPNSVPQLKDLLFREWNLPPTDYTKLGEPSTADECLRAMRMANKDDPKVVVFMDALRRYRRVVKEYGTYVRPLVPRTVELDAIEMPEEDEPVAAGEDPAGAESDGVPMTSPKGLVLDDGRVHPDYNAHRAVTGRLSSSHPNSQNFPLHLRRMIVAQPGHVIVGADADQLELRIITAVARIKLYLDAFAEKKDPHAMTAALMYGSKFTQLVPKTKLWDDLRKLAKTIKYASFYGSGDATVHGIVTAAEDDDGRLIYPDLSVREVGTMKKNWLSGIPELPRWWDDTLDEFRRVGYLTDPVWGRRRDFLDGEEFNEIVNFRIQSGGAHLIHDSTFALLRAIPFFKWGHGTGLVNQMHDALYLEVPCPHGQQDVPILPNGKPDEKKREFGWCPPLCTCPAAETARTLEACMNRTIPGLDGVVFSAKAHIGRAWGGD